MTTTAAIQMETSLAEHPWISSYPDGVRWDAELPLMPVQQLLDDAVGAGRTGPALEFIGRTISYRELRRAGRPGREGLSGSSASSPGVHVGLFLPNSPHYPIAFFGVLKAGGTVVNYSPLDAERVLAHKIEDSRDRHPRHARPRRAVPADGATARQSRLKKLIVGSLADYGGAASGAARICRQPATGRVHGRRAPHRFEPARERRRYRTPRARRPAHDEIVVLQYTGGTTGLPKGAMLTHANLIAACAQYLESTARRSTGPRRRRRTRAGRAAAVPHLFAHRQHAARHPARAPNWCFTRASTSTP